MTISNPASLDRYVIQRHLAEGGMGAVFLGKKLGPGGFEKEVVLKRLRPDHTKQADLIELFLREARLTATLDHANIVHTIDLVNARNEYFMVMEYVRGADLRTLLRRARPRGGLAPAAALLIAREVLSALSYAHQKAGSDGRTLGLIHRDVSPSNILISAAGEVKLTDFGIAARTDSIGPRRVRGKVGYMSPEQADNRPLDPRSDLYSLAVCLYEMLTGERLHVDAGPSARMYDEPVPPVSRKRQGVPSSLDPILARALQVDPARRYQTAGELHEAILRAAHRAGLMFAAADLARHMADVCGPVSEWGATPSEESPAGTEVYSPAAEEDVGRLTHVELTSMIHAVVKPPGRRRLAVALALLGLVLGAIGYLVLFRR